MNFWFILDSKNICLVHKNISIFIAFSCIFLKENHVNNYRKVKEPSFSLSSRNSTSSIYDAELQTNKLHYPEFWFSPFQTHFWVLFLSLTTCENREGTPAKQALNSLFCITPLIFQEPNSLRFHAHPNHNRDNSICIVVFHYLITNVSFHNCSRTLSIPWLFCYLWDISLKALNCIYRVLTALLLVSFAWNQIKDVPRQAGTTSLGNSS